MDKPSNSTGPVTRVLYRRILTAADPAKVQLQFEAGVLARYREAGYQLKRTNSVGRVKAPAWTIDFGISSDESILHASLGDLFRLPEAERQHWAVHLLQPGLSENYLKMMLHPGSCIDDGDTRDW